jgi:cytochrome P450
MTVGRAAADLTDPDLHAFGDPHAVWRTLREHESVRWHDTKSGPGFWSVVRHADVARVLGDYRAFTSSRGTLLNLLGQSDPASGSQLAATDPPLHNRMRRPLQHAMTRRSVLPRREAIRSRIGRLLDVLADGGEVDVAAVMLGVPLTVVGPLLGLPEADWPELTRLVAMSSAEDDPAYQLPDGPQATLRFAHRELFAYFLDLVKERRRTPGEDLVSLLLSLEVDGERLTPGAVLSNCYSLLLGATATTPHVPTALLAELMRTGGYAEWAEDRSPTEFAVEEALRWASPASHFMRHATEPVTLGGTRIGAGDPVVAWLGSANRDAAVFADPDRLDRRRSPNRHLAFGAGHHYCIGAPITRLALRLLFEELFARFESFEPAGHPVRVRSVFLAGFRVLPVTARLRQQM